MDSIAIFLSSRNNYDMLPIFLKNNNLEGYKLYNIDDCSKPEEIKKGKEICELNNIPFIENEDRGLQWAWHTIVNEVGDNIKFVIWCTHDTFPITDNFFSKLDELGTSGKLDDFGIIGFNTFGPQCGVKDIKLVSTESCGILGKAPLMELPGRGGWYRPTDMELPWNIYGKPFAVESPTDMCWMINVNLFKKYIKPSNNFHLFGSPEDVSLQFLYNNIYNIVLPDFAVWHNQHIKEEVKIPVKSARAAKNGDAEHFGHVFPKEFWKEKWGWERDNRITFENVKEKYKGTLIYEMYHHDSKKGPFRRFDI